MAVYAKNMAAVVMNDGQNRVVGLLFKQWSMILYFSSHDYVGCSTYG